MPRKTNTQKHEAFYEAMLHISALNDIELRHAMADSLMENLLITLGYTKGVGVFRDMERLYS